MGYINEVVEHIPCFQRGLQFQIVCFLLFAGIEIFEVILLIIMKRFLFILGIDGKETAIGQVVREYRQVFEKGKQFGADTFVRKQFIHCKTPDQDGRISTHLFLIRNVRIYFFLA